MDQYERTECVRHCKWADEIICPCPWTLTIVNSTFNKNQDFLKQNNIKYVGMPIKISH